MSSKLKLDVDRLAVVSFETKRDAEKPGTVNGQQCAFSAPGSCNELDYAQMATCLRTNCSPVLCCA